MSEQELHRQTLLRNEFDLFLMRLPPRFTDPDALYTLLHSRFAEDPGWQNPFGYANLDVDDHLETQRRTNGSQRRDALRQLQLTAARTQPFTLLTVPDDVRAVRTTNYSNWRASSLDSSLGYLSLERSDDVDSETGGTLRVAITDRRATTNLNPLSVEFRRTGTLTGLVYDPLGYVFQDRLMPWLAETWEFSDDRSSTAQVTIRKGATWHDGKALTADDVAFTYRLLSDTTLGSDSDEETAPLPSPRYRGRSSLVANVNPIGDRTVEFQFADVTPSVARRAFTVPILPEHIWKERTDVASIAGIQTGSVTEALVTNNIPPVGSGPLRFVRNTPREEVVFERFDDHVLHQVDSPINDLVDQAGDAAFDTLSIQVVGSDVTAAEMVANDTADVTGTPVGADVIPRIGRRSESELLVQRSSSAYVLGYNTRNQHLNNPRFRHTLARLIDGEYIADAIVDGYGRPAVGPLWDTEWYPSELQWEERNPIANFLGSEGEIDVARARAAFREAGYRYEDGKLVGGRT
ncbi:ABC transporter substrate-binding protein [Halobellus inordinatus]|uniref:ABC transporter substrate-binding protein n=1 Tax=Halobellus inordinatus TaxID=1126236 RepID=UPI00210CB90F|nr:ABC transporter substrate-binding protein [Halobellus inordinatus]